MLVSTPALRLQIPSSINRLFFLTHRAPFPRYNALPVSSSFFSITSSEAYTGIYNRRLNHNELGLLRLMSTYRHSMVNPRYHQRMLVPWNLVMPEERPLYVRTTSKTSRKRPRYDRKSKLSKYKTILKRKVKAPSHPRLRLGKRRYTLRKALPKVRAKKRRLLYQAKGIQNRSSRNKAFLSKKKRDLQMKAKKLKKAGKNKISKKPGTLRWKISSVGQLKKLEHILAKRAERRHLKKGTIAKYVGIQQFDAEIRYSCLFACLMH